MKSLRTIFTGVILLIAMAILQQPGVTHAQSAVDEIQEGVDQISGENDNRSAGSSIKSIVNVFLFLVGAVAVVIIIFAGFKYVTSGGDASAVTSAKNTLLYAVIGVIVAILAYAIVNFAMDAFASKPYEGPPQPTTPNNGGQPY